MQHSSSCLTDLEHDALVRLVKAKGEVDQALLIQANVAKVAGREYTGAGMYVTLSVPDDAPRSEKPDAVLSKVSGSCADLKEGFGAIAFVEKGALSLLEFFTYDEPWPDNITSFELRTS